MSLVTTGLVFVLTGGLVHLVSARLGLAPQAWPFPRPRAASLWGLVAITVGWTLVSLVMIASASAPVAPPDPAAALPAAATRSAYGISALVGQLVLAALAFGPALLVMAVRREPWASVGVTRRGLGRAAAVGILLSALFVGLDVLGGASDAGRAPVPAADRLGALALCAIVGFGEEFGFRGFLQGRFVAWLGPRRGWLAASVLMALAHVTQRIAVQGLSPLEALASSAALIPVSLFSGYVMLRSGHLVVPALLHTCFDWLGTW